MIKVTAETITAAVTVKAIFFAFVFPENTASRILPQIRHTSHAIGNRIPDISALMDAYDRINIATEASNSNAAAAERHIAVTLPPLCAIFGSDGIDSIAKSHNTEEITPSAAATNRTPNIPIVMAAPIGSSPEPSYTIHAAAHKTMSATHRARCTADTITAIFFFIVFLLSLCR